MEAIACHLRSAYDLLSADQRDAAGIGDILIISTPSTYRVCAKCWATVRYRNLLHYAVQPSAYGRPARLAAALARGVGLYLSQV